MQTVLTDFRQHNKWQKMTFQGTKAKIFVRNNYYENFAVDHKKNLHACED